MHKKIISKSKIKPVQPLLSKVQTFWLDCLPACYSIVGIMHKIVGIMHKKIISKSKIKPVQPLSKVQTFWLDCLPACYSMTQHLWSPGQPLHPNVNESANEHNRGFKNRPY